MKKLNKGEIARRMRDIISVCLNEPVVPRNEEEAAAIACLTLLDLGVRLTKKDKRYLRKIKDGIIFLELQSLYQIDKEERRWLS